VNNNPNENFSYNFYTNYNIFQKFSKIFGKFISSFRIVHTSEIFWNILKFLIPFWKIFLNYLDYIHLDYKHFIRNYTYKKILELLRYFIYNIKNSENRYRFFLRSIPIRIKNEKVIKLYRNSEKLYEKFWEKFSSGKTKTKIGSTAHRNWFYPSRTEFGHDVGYCMYDMYWN